ncbi:MAG: SRPBCC domain-containing protein [Fimbriimonadaceae bacterium]|nr:SRPBCC domain-containing protein [Fimbriimonadaceae bacterium]
MKTRTDFIGREIIIKAPRERVWESVRHPDGMAKWFFNSWRGEWEVGKTVWFYFDGYGEIPAIPTEISDERVSFAWTRYSEETADPTLDDFALRVTFEVFDHAEGTLLKVLETGYNNMSEDDYAKEFPDHEEGWTMELGELVASVETQ